MKVSEFGLISRVHAAFPQWRGHLVEGCLIYTTAEIVIGEARGLMFSREQAAETGYQELRIRKAPHSRTR
jgi:predicted DNA-binding protein with PD1-like motif